MCASIDKHVLIVLMGFVISEHFLIGIFFNKAYGLRIIWRIKSQQSNRYNLPKAMVLAVTLNSN